MSKRFMVLMGAVLAVAVLGAAIAMPTLAQEPTPQLTQPPKVGFGPRGLGIGPWGGRWTTFDATAEALGLSPVELFNELHAGKSLSDIAEAQGVELETVHQAAQAARAEAMKAAIQQGVEDGHLTQEQADWMLEGLEKGFMPRLRGLEGRMRGHFGPHQPPPPPTAPGSSS